MINVKKKIEENTEYSIRMPDGKIQKFAYYGEKENGRLILLNTRFGTLTSMNAAYFMKLISGKYPCVKRPYNVEYPEGYEQVKAPSVGEITAKKIENYKARIEQEGKEYADKETKEMLKWATRLKTLPDHEEEILEKELKIAPYTLGENLEQFANNEYKDSMVQLFDAYSKVKGLLKGTAWDVK